MALPTTFQANSESAGTWCSTSGAWKIYDLFAVSRRLPPTVAVAGVDPRTHLDINLRVDHRLTGATHHLPSVHQPGAVDKCKGSNLPLRAGLKLPQVREALQQDIAGFPLPHPRMLVEEPYRLVSKLFRVMRVRPCGMPQRVPHSSWITSSVCGNNWVATRRCRVSLR